MQRDERKDRREARQGLPQERPGSEAGMAPADGKDAAAQEACTVTTLPLRARRLEDLARQVAQHSYVVDARELARAILEKEPDLLGNGQQGR